MLEAGKVRNEEKEEAQKEKQRCRTEAPAFYRWEWLERSDRMLPSVDRLITSKSISSFSLSRSGRRGAHFKMEAYSLHTKSKATTR